MLDLSLLIYLHLAIQVWFKNIEKVIELMDSSTRQDLNKIQVGIYIISIKQVVSCCLKIYHKQIPIVTVPMSIKYK